MAHKHGGAAHLIPKVALVTLGTMLVFLTGVYLGVKGQTGSSQLMQQVALSERANQTAKELQEKTGCNVDYGTTALSLVCDGKTYPVLKPYNKDGQGLRVVSRKDHLVAFFIMSCHAEGCPGQDLRILDVKTGKVKTPDLTSIGKDYGVLWHTAAASPDGLRLAVIAQDQQRDQPARITVVNLFDDTLKTVYEGPHDEEQEVVLFSSPIQLGIGDNSQYGLGWKDNQTIVYETFNMQNVPRAFYQVPVTAAQ